MDELWEEVWLELREALVRQPPRNANSRHPCVLTLGHEVANDIIRVGEDGIVVRSERTGRDDFIEARRIQVWWDHLQAEGSASLIPGGANNPHPWRSRLVGAIWARCLPHRVEWDRARPNELRLIGHEAITRQA
jgi:hypothetical protein